MEKAERRDRAKEYGDSPKRESKGVSHLPLFLKTSSATQSNRVIYKAF